MRGLIIASIMLLVGIAFSGAETAKAQSAHKQAAGVSDISGQSTRAKRARTRIRVTPARRLVRQCEFHLAREVRASGTYIVPREHCWWARR